MEISNELKRIISAETEIDPIRIVLPKGDFCIGKIDDSNRPGVRALIQYFDTDKLFIIKIREINNDWCFKFYNLLDFESEGRGHDEIKKITAYYPYYILNDKNIIEKIFPSDKEEILTRFRSTII